MRTVAMVRFDRFEQRGGTILCAYVDVRPLRKQHRGALHTTSCMEQMDKYSNCLEHYPTLDTPTFYNIHFVKFNPFEIHFILRHLSHPT